MPNNDSPQSFASDNNSGILPEVMEAIMAANQGHSPAYGGEDYTARAIKTMKKCFGEHTKAFFVFNGTAANVCALQAVTQRYQSVICSKHSHIHKDECGAPEAIAGIKLIVCPSKDAKLNTEEIEKKLIRKGDQHFSQAAVISITQPTELGTVYTPVEIKKISDFAKKNGLLVHMDGSRLVNACEYLGLNLEQASFQLGVDVLSFGGTKNGLMLGEAVVFKNKNLAKDFHFIRKQNLQLAGKMKFISVQFEAWLTENLWIKYAGHANKMAKKLEQMIRTIEGIEITQKVETNVVFAKISRETVDSVRKHFFFYIWDEHSMECRLMTTFNTTEAAVEQFVEKLKKGAK